MAGNMSNYLEDKIQDHVLGGGDYTRPATVYIGLWTATLDDTSTGATSGEVSGSNYSRVAVTNNATNFPASSSGEKHNGTAINFPTPSGSWGTVTHVAILDASSAGNILYWIALTASKAINSGDTVSFATSALSIQAN